MLDIFPDNWWPLIKSAALPIAIIATWLFIYFFARKGLNALQARSAIAPPVISLLRILLRWALFILVVFLLLSAFDVLEAAWAAFLAILAMVAIGFVAVWSVLSNAFCTLLILIYQPFQIGDTISIPSDSIKGKVIDLNLMFTTLSEQDGVIIQVPNNQFFQKAIQRIPGKAKRDLYEQLKQPDRFDGSPQE